jgi:hypothetical protein
MNGGSDLCPGHAVSGTSATCVIPHHRKEGHSRRAATNADPSRLLARRAQRRARVTPGLLRAFSSTTETPSAARISNVVSGFGHLRPEDPSSYAAGQRIRGARDRHPPSGLPGPRHWLRRAPCYACPEEVRRLLPRPPPNRGIHMQSPDRARHLPPTRPQKGAQIFTTPVLGGLHDCYGFPSNRAPP